MTMAVQRRRCAIYTRKSTEEGLEQQFNSLDAQRESCEAYILSQAGEGWECLPDLYDDGGWSGGNMDRPSLKRLLADIATGRIDVVVVYKVDRLTRSLMDFARIVETFDTHNVSFVSVTQAFNTTSSMSRLTLNVLLSFAQFEREVTGEPIRDKIAASKAKGMWMGGNIPLGYDLGERRLDVNSAEAKIVQHIFERYLALGSIPALANELAASGIRSKRWVSRRGVVHGDMPFRCGSLSLILNNRTYIGQIVHKGKIHIGDHDAIVDTALFEAVQAKLEGNRQTRSAKKARAASCPLAGKLFDADGQPMRPSFGYGRGKKTYRYYVSETLLPNGKIGNAGNMRGDRISAERIERVLAAQMLPHLPAGTAMDEMFGMIARVTHGDGRLHLTIPLSALVVLGLTPEMVLGRLQHHIDPKARIDGADLLLTLDARAARRGKTLRAKEHLRDASDHRTILTDLVRASHRKLHELSASPLNPASHAAMRSPNNEWSRVRIPVGLLAPDIQKALLQGTAPPNLAPDRLLSRDLPLDWNEQRRFLGMQA